LDQVHDGVNDVGGAPSDRVVTSGDAATPVTASSSSRAPDPADTSVTIRADAAGLNRLDLGVPTAGVGANPDASRPPSELDSSVDAVGQLDSDLMIDLGRPDSGFDDALTDMDANEVMPAEDRLDMFSVDLATPDASPMDANAFMPAEDRLDMFTVDMATLDASPMVNMASCPVGPGVDDCRFGWTTRQLEEQESMRVQLEQRIRAGMPLPALVGRQLVFGFSCEGLFAPPTPQAAFDLLDMDGLRVYRIDDLLTGQVYTWHKFYMGDTEVGYLYAYDTLTLVGIVGDGDINRCQIER
ncbi:MAG: hypothetical protein VX589_11740, partial [Myxococcota bacterium]|nr:hypothetical protein [Myxococcota bacterium]